MLRLLIPSSQGFLAGCAMLFIGGMGVTMCFYTVPTPNHDFVVFILGALSGAITVSGGSKAIDAVKASNAPEAPAKEPPAAPII